MRFALWLLGLFGVAVAVALFAGRNPGTVTLFWPPYRIDLSLNFALLLLLGAFSVVHLALQAIAALFALPDKAQQWRAQRHERALHRAVLESLAHLNAGRFARARRSARAALASLAMQPEGEGALPPSHVARLRGLAHWLVAESAHALGEPTARDEQSTLALAAQPDALAREGLLLSAARWALDDGDARAALAWLDALAPDAARRVLARRLRLRAWQRARCALPALEAARMLARHDAQSGTAAAQGLVRCVVLDAIAHTCDAPQLQALFDRLMPHERALPQIAIAAAQRLRALGGEPALSRRWLLPAWERLAATDEPMPDAERIRLVRALDFEAAAGDREQGTEDIAWRQRIEAALERDPDDPLLQYLCGMARLNDPSAHAAAAALLERAARGLDDAALKRSASRALARLARQRGEPDAAASGWQHAAAASSD